jgi:hypothetical protein
MGIVLWRLAATATCSDQAGLWGVTAAILGTKICRSNAEIRWRLAIMRKTLS